ncbi:hypothetical protein GQ457_10G025590 [Hibiscus cannabinus]
MCTSKLGWSWLRLPTEHVWGPSYIVISHRLLDFFNRETRILHGHPWFGQTAIFLTDKCGKHFKRTPSGYLESNGVVCLKDNAKTWITQHFTIVVH